MTDDSTSGAMPTVLDEQPLARGAAPAPRTVVDGQPAAPGGAPVTSLDSGGGAGAPLTTLDHESAGPPGDWHAVNLPPPLHERFRIVRMLPSGAEADVVLAESRPTGERVAIKVFRTRDFSSPEMQALLQKLDAVSREHVIGVLERGQYGGRWWEVMPYAEHGSLDDLRCGALEPMVPEQVRQVLVQVTHALAAVHAAQLIHRDVKPQNLLVLDIEPLRVVLGDFGLARIVAATREQGSTSRTPAYAAPESLHGQLHATRDWWSLGITCLELLWGRNPFQEPGGDWMDEHVILETILSGRGIPRGPVMDPRWSLLLDGLLTQDHRQRWGRVEVLRWLDGESPKVHAARQTSAPAGPPFVFNGVVHTDPLELARAFEADAAGTARITKGFAVNAPQSAALLGWLRARDHDVRELEGTRSPERAQVLLMTMLDPQAAPAVSGVSVAREDLTVLVSAAARSGWSGREAQVLETLRRSGALGVLARLDGHGELAVIDEQWQRTTDQLEPLVQRLPEDVRRQVGHGTAPLQAAQAWLLVAAVTGDLPKPRPSSDTATARQQRWFAELAQDVPGRADDVARRALVEVTMNLAADMTREQDARRQREAREDQERRRQQDERARNYRASVRAGRTEPVLAWAALVLAFVLPPVGAALGVLSLRQGFRYHFRRRKKAYLAVLVGGMSSVVYVMNALESSFGLAA